jgi:hypothetical protein
MTKQDFIIKSETLYKSAVLTAYAVCIAATTRKEHTARYYNLKQAAIVATHVHAITGEQFQTITANAYAVRKGIAV